MGDVRDRGRCAEALEGVDVVVHPAAAVGVARSLYKVEYYEGRLPNDVFWGPRCTPGGSRSLAGSRPGRGDSLLQSLLLQLSLAGW